MTHPFISSALSCNIVGNWLGYSPIQDQERLILESLTTLSYRADTLDHYLYEIVSSVSRLLQSHWTIVTIYQGDAGQVVASSMGLGEQNQGFSVHGTLVEKVIEARKPILIEDVNREPDCPSLPNHYQAYLGIPLHSPFGSCIGTICSFFEQPQRFTAERVRQVGLFAERAATALDNYQLYQQQQQLNAELRETNRQLQLEIQERQQIEQEIVRLAEVGELASMIVHEVRNPLTTILLGLMAMKGCNLPESAHLRLALALEEAERLQRLLNEILLYARRQSLHCSRLNLNQLMADMQVSFWSFPVSTNRSIELISHMPEAWVWGDRDKLKQVFINLLKNACEAVEEGDVVHWSIEPGSTPTQVRVCVHNPGHPIPPDLLKKLGTPFCTTKPDGNGLGLAIVRRIITAHGGDLTIQSEWGAGTNVCIQLSLMETCGM